MWTTLQYLSRPQMRRTTSHATRNHRWCGQPPTPRPTTSAAADHRHCRPSRTLRPSMNPATDHGHCDHPRALRPSTGTVGNHRHCDRPRRYHRTKGTASDHGIAAKAPTLPPTGTLRPTTERDLHGRAQARHKARVGGGHCRQPQAVPPTTDATTNHGPCGDRLRRGVGPARCDSIGYRATDLLDVPAVVVQTGAHPPGVGAEPPRVWWGLHCLWRMESWQVRHGTRPRCVSGRCGWFRSIGASTRRGRRRCARSRRGSG